MQNIPLLLMAVVLLITFQCCGTDKIQLPEGELQGKIESVEWIYSSANAFRLSRDGQYQIRFLSAEEPVSNPCSLPRPGLAHVKAIITPGLGNFAVSPQALANNQVQVAFETAPSRTLIANSGFMEIFDFNGATMLGYLQASEDAENTFVSGRFTVEFCD
ncbi:MAG: hypothetical protein OXH57_11180 [Ekhidna sp.]|nr:hypothetical protein [Ekhidna sp.]